MRLLMHILKKNKNLNIDNENLSIANIMLKLQEEYHEVLKAIINYSKNNNLANLKEIIRETYDLIQICILILWRYHRVAKNKFKKPNLVQEINLEHKDKLLVERGWEALTGIEIEVKE